MPPWAVAALAVLGSLAGTLAWVVADRVLAARDDAPPPGPSWGAAAGALCGAALFAATGAVVGWSWVLPAYLWFVALTLTLVVTDLRARLIPDRISFPGTAVAVGLLALGAVADGSGSALGRAVLGAVLYTAFLFVLFVVGRGRSFGFGDVKLAPVLGVFTTYVGWDALFVAIFLGILLGGVAGLLLLVLRLRKLRDHFAFGPPLVVGAYLGIAVGADLMEWYLR